MEKRALIAFALSLLILFLWEVYFGGLIKSPTPPPQESQTTAPSTAPPPLAGSPGAPQSLPPTSLPDGTRPAPVAGQEYESWTVDSSLYTMQIHGAGGRIQDFRLEQYNQASSPDSPAMGLIPTRSSGYLPLAVDLIHHPQWQLSTRPFSGQGPSRLTVSPQGGPQVLNIWTEEQDQFRLTKAFTFLPNEYAIDLQVQLLNLGSQPLADQLAVSFFYQPYDLEKNSYNQSDLVILQEGSLNKFQLKDLQKKNPAFTPPYEWVGYEDNYFINAFVPVDGKGQQVVPKILDADKGLIQLTYLSDPFQIEPGQQKTVTMRLYLGPKEIDKLEQAGHQLSRSVDFGWFGFLARPLLEVLKWLYGYVHNYGVAIIVLTVIIKILFWPLTHKSYKSMQVMKKIQPKINQVREKYKDDREKLNQELMQVYRTYKVNPLGGCLPMVLQIPVFFALYRMLSGSVELLHEPFALWINDLTAPDRLHVGFDIPYLGGLPVLTVLMGLSMFFQQKMTPSTGDPRQEKIMLYMPLMFTFFFINLPAGLVLYWLVNNILSIVQQYWINRHA